MLYDPKWKKQVDAGPSLVGLITWLEKLPPAETYNYHVSSHCLMAQYFKSCGVEKFDLACIEVDRFFGNKTDEMNPAVEHPWTFGAALERCRKWQITH